MSNPKNIRYHQHTQAQLLPDGVPVFRVSVELTDAQIKTLPTGVTILAATDTPNYARTPTSMPVFLGAFVNCKFATGYTNNADETIQVYSGDIDYAVSSACDIDLSGGTNGDVQFIAPQSQNMNNGFHDNGLKLKITKDGGNTPLTGGDPANTLTVTLLYTIVDL